MGVRIGLVGVLNLNVIEQAANLGQLVGRGFAVAQRLHHQLQGRAAEGGV
nr:hypothetical protein [Tanacetum cinerariifolium]